MKLKHIAVLMPAAALLVLVGCVEPRERGDRIVRSHSEPTAAPSRGSGMSLDLRRPGPALRSPGAGLGPGLARAAGAGEAVGHAKKLKKMRPAELVASTPRFGPPPPPHAVRLGAAAGSTPFLTRVPTEQPVVFLTIDDGYVQDPTVLAVIRKARIRLTAFLTVFAVNYNTGFFAELQDMGSRIESHAITHRRLRGEPYWFQWEQICGSAVWLGNAFGQRPRLLRPPYGLKDDTTLKVARACGYHATVHWTASADDGYFVPYDYPGPRSGDIILLHFRDNLAQSLVYVLTEIHRAGLTPALLEDYLH